MNNISHLKPELEMKNLSAIRHCYISSVILFIGIIVSGLPGNLLINAIHPQSPWIDIETYAASFHPLQMLTFWAGFVMLIGFIGLVAAIHYIVSGAHKYFTFLAVIAASIYAALISLNYILQLGVLQPSIKKHELQGMTFLVFANPYSVAMSIEMLGYGFQGAATWLISFVFDNSRPGKWIKWLGITNGIVSIAGTIIQGLNVSMAIDNPFGMIVFVGWNLLFTILCLLYLLYFKKKYAIAIKAEKEEARMLISSNKVA